MTEKAAHWCVFLPCSGEEVWAIPQSCLAEIVTIHDAGESPPQEIVWRGREVAVLDLGDEGKAPWRDPTMDTGLVAVILGLKGQGSDYWAVALRGEGLALKNLADEQILDLPDKVSDRSTAAFEMRDAVFQVPDLPEMQKQLAMYRIPA